MPEEGAGGTPQGPQETAGGRTPQATQDGACGGTPQATQEGAGGGMLRAPPVALALRRAGGSDIPFIMATERRPGYERSVGRWEAAAHEAEMRKAASAYFIGERDGRPLGFAMLLDLDEPNGNLHLKRLAVAEPGGGIGRSLLTGVLAWSFARPLTHRFWLTVAPRNEPARHLYRSLGLREDGQLREAYVNPAGERGTLILMSILRPEWEATRL